MSGLTAAQESKLAKLGDSHKVVGFHNGAVLVRRPHGEVVRLMPTGLWRPLGVGALHSLVRRHGVDDAVGARPVTNTDRLDQLDRSADERRQSRRGTPAFNDRRRRSVAAAEPELHDRPV
jgi:hypothetical protein